jgi:hypothetical protein
MTREAMGRGVVEEARNRRENSVRRLNQIACCISVSVTTQLLEVGAIVLWVTGPV